jgi:hypothetical protein
MSSPVLARLPCHGTPGDTALGKLVGHMEELEASTMTQVFSSYTYQTQAVFQRA